MYREKPFCFFFLLLGGEKYLANHLRASQSAREKHCSLVWYILIKDIVTSPPASWLVHLTPDRAVLGSSPGLSCCILFLARLTAWYWGKPCDGLASHPGRGRNSRSHFMPVSLSSWLACRPLRNLDPRFLPVPSNHYVTWRTSDLLNVLRLILCFSWQITWENGRKIKPSYRYFFPIFLRRKRICSCCKIFVTLWSLNSLRFCWLQKINGLLWVEIIHLRIWLLKLLLLLLLFFKTEFKNL